MRFGHYKIRDFHLSLIGKVALRLTCDTDRWWRVTCHMVRGFGRGSNKYGISLSKTLVWELGMKGKSSFGVIIGIGMWDWLVLFLWSFEWQWTTKPYFSSTSVERDYFLDYCVEHRITGLHWENDELIGILQRLYEINSIRTEEDSLWRMLTSFRCFQMKLFHEVFVILPLNHLGYEGSSQTSIFCLVSSAW